MYLRTPRRIPFVTRRLSSTRAFWVGRLFLGSPRDSRSRRQLHVPGKSKKFQAADDPVAHVDLPPAQAMASGSWKGVMRVVTTIAQAKDPKQTNVVAMVVTLIRLPSHPDTYAA